MACYVLFCSVVVCCAVLCCAVLCFVVLCSVVLCCAVLCCAALCCVVLRCVVLRLVRCEILLDQGDLSNTSVEGGGWERQAIEAWLSQVFGSCARIYARRLAGGIGGQVASCLVIVSFVVPGDLF